MHKLRPRNLLAFGAVGCAAAGTHFATVALTVPLGLAPLAANVVGFCSAIGVSFLGHNRWSFPAPGRAKRAAAVRFVVLACSMFVLNETLYWAVLRTGLDYRVALALVLGGLATATFFLSHRWVFADV